MSRQTVDCLRSKVKKVTASLARLLPVFDDDGNQVPAPPPLRDDTYPDGFPWLRGTNQLRVQTANVLYNVVADTCEYPFERPVLLAVENPRGSLMWKTTMWARASPRCPIKVDLQNCSYGGDRPKWTRICCNDHVFLSLQRSCPGGRCLLNHKAWGRASSGGWATAEETAYPPGLARAIAKCFFSAVEHVPFQDPSLPEVRARTGPQPKASAFGPLVPEHREVRVMHAHTCFGSAPRAAHGPPQSAMAPSCLHR